ncbi:MAG: class I SAM-dependent methyltransferase [Ignavibacteriae bacterium]|nr:class I SAM-dependent methyltransferase [Ignavibacteriota bacterium]
MPFHVCPWWLTYTFDNPIRKLVHNPSKIFSGLVRRGARVLDVGCGMGYFTIPLARMVGEQGAVFAVDLQKEMLAAVRRRAARAGVLSRVRMVQCKENSLGVSEKFDFASAFWMVHEVPDQRQFLCELFSLMKPSGKFLLVEPKGHVNAAEFRETVRLATSVGFVQKGSVRVALSRSALLARPADGDGRS